MGRIGNVIRANSMQLDVERVKPCAWINQHREGLDLVVGVNTGQADLADAGRIAAGGFNVQCDEAEAALRYAVCVGEGWSGREASDFWRPLVGSAGSRLVWLRRFWTAAEQPVKKRHEQTFLKNAAKGPIGLRRLLASPQNGGVRMPVGRSWRAQPGVLERARKDQAGFHLLQPRRHPPRDFEVLVGIVDQLVVPSQQGVMGLGAFGHVGSAGEAFVIALVAVETRGVFIHAHSAAGADRFAKTKAGTAVAVGTAEALLRKRARRDQREGDEQRFEFHSGRSSFGNAPTIFIVSRLTVMTRWNNSSG